MSVLDNIKRIINSKKEIKEVVNQDFNKIIDEKIDSYSSLIDETIEEYKDYIPIEKVTGESVNITNAAPLSIKNGRIYPAEISKQKTTEGRNKCPSNFEFFESGQYNVDGTKIDTNSRIRLIDFFEIEVGEEYYFNCFSDNYKFTIRQYDKNKNFISSYGAIDNDVDITFAENAHFLGISIYNPNDSTITFSTYKNLFENGDIKPFVCLSSEINKNFEEYTGGQASPNPDYPQEIETIKELTLKIQQDENITSIPIYLQGNEIVKLPNYIKDILQIDKKGNISLVKNNRKLIFSGIENFKYSVASNGINRFYCALDNALKNSDSILSNYFKGNLQNAYSNVFIGSNGAIHFCYAAETVEEFIEFLNNNNVIVYYPLETPEIIPLGNLSELIRTFPGINNIWIESNLGTTIEVEYYKDYKLENNTEVIEEKEGE